MIVHHSQMNIDYALCKAIKFSCPEGLRTVLLAYDINCQYSVHLPDRLKNGEYLQVRDDLVLVFGIGLFHVHGHQASCNARFSLTYIRGAGMSAGEILESLWSVVNEAARTTATMSLGHRAEVLDAVMGDSNWKKILSLGMPPNIFYLTLSNIDS
jgi:Kyakuja-Dileera-Zisupton transposase